MSKKFTEYSQLNLSEINKEVLKKWDVNDVFSKSMRGILLSCSTKVLPRLTVCRVFTT